MAHGDRRPKGDVLGQRKIGLGVRCLSGDAEAGFDLSEEAVEGAGADVVEGLDFGAELLGEGEVEVGQGGAGSEGEVLTGIGVALGFADEDEGEVFFDVAVAVFHFAAVEDEAVVEEGAVAFFDAAHLGEEVFDLLGIPAADGGVFFDEGFLIFVMAHAVVVVFDAVEEGEVLAAEAVGAHEGGDACGVGLEGEDDEVEHEAHVLVFVQGEACGGAAHVPGETTGSTRGWGD